MCRKIEGKEEQYRSIISCHSGEMKIYTFFYACVPWLKKLHFPWVGPTENIYLTFNWLPTFPLLKKICQSEGGEERERERDIWNDPTSRCASAMIYCEQVVTHTSSNRWGGTRDGKGNKSAAQWGQTGGKVVKNWEKSNKWKHWKEKKCVEERLFREGGERKQCSPKFGCIPDCLDPRAAFSLPDLYVVIL